MLNTTLKSSVLLSTRCSTGVDGTLSFQRSLQSVTPYRAVYKLPSRGFSQTKEQSEQEEVHSSDLEESGPQAKKPQKQQSRLFSKNEDDDWLFSDEEFGPQPVFSTDVSTATSSEEYIHDPQTRRMYERIKEAQFKNAKRHRVFAKDGLPILTTEEMERLAEQDEIRQETQPILKRKFNMDEYNDWKKEVDKETLRTQQKIEHYKRSEELLQALQQRIQSAKTDESQKELSEYLLSKLGYKNQSYSDFISNQMIHTGEAQAEVKKTSMLKAEKEAHDFLAYNDNQVRDSNTLNSKHAWSPDSFLPSSIIDQLGYQKDRKLMTQQEYTESRAQDADILMKKRLVWSGHEHRFDEFEHQKVYNRNEAIKILKESDGRTFTELLKDMDLSKEEIAKLTENKELKMRNFQYQVNELAGKAKVVQKELKQLSDEEGKLSEEYEKTIVAMGEEIQRQDAVNPDDIKTSDFELPSTSETENEARQEQREIDRIVENIKSDASASEVERQLMQGEEFNDEWQYVKNSEISKVTEDLKKDPNFYTQIIDNIANLQEEEALQKKMQASQAIEGFERESETEPGSTDPEDAAADRELLFFEEKAAYIEFTKTMMKMDTKEMTPEEKASLMEIQKLIKESTSAGPEITGSEEVEIHDIRQRDFNARTPHSLEQLEKAGDIFEQSDPDALPNIDYETMIKRSQGQFEGVRRFERVDRVSLDSETDKLNALKLKLNSERVYDPEAIHEAIADPLVMTASADLGEYARSGVQIRQKTRDDMSPSTSEASDRDLSEEHSSEEFNPKIAVLLENSVSELSEAEQLERQQIQDLKLTAAEQKQVETAEKLLESKAQQLKNKDGNVDRLIYQDDWIHRDKSAEMITQQPYDNMNETLEATGVKAKLKAQYMQAKNIEGQIIEHRKRLATRINEVKRKLDTIQNDHTNLRKKLLKSNAAHFEHVIQPKQARKAQKIEQTLAAPSFNTKSSNVSDYERELSTVSKLGLHKKAEERDSLLRQFEFIFDAMKNNKVHLTPAIRGHMFEYLAVRNDFTLANKQLQFLAKDMTESESPINPHYLTYYLKQCLKLDKIDGVAYLTNYVQRYNLDTSNMPIHKFHSMLDYYLNHNFDLSKVMTFLKFYKQYYNDCIRKELPQIITSKQKPGTLDDLQIKLLHKRVFAKHDSLVDMRALSKFIVRKAGNKPVVDPFTQEDSVYGLIELFTQSPDVYQASALSKHNHIEPSTIAEYFGTRLNYPDTLEKIMKIAFRLDGTIVGREFSKVMLEQVKTYQNTKQGELPATFTKQSLRSLYQRAVSAEKKLKTSNELLLYLMQQRGLHLEVVDLCERQPKLEMSRYYLTESLMRVPSTKKGAYLEAVNKVFGSEPTHMGLTQRTKAIMLEEGPQAAYAFFQEEFAKIEEHAKKKKALLVSLYDTLLPKDAKNVSFEVFKERYLQSQRMAARFAKEAFVVNKLENILRGKDYNQIENVVNLYAVMREERLLTQPEYLMNEDRQLVQVNHSSQKKEQLKTVQKRRAQLESLVGLADTEDVKSIQNVMQDEPLQVFDNVNEDLCHRIAQCFKDITEDEAASIESRNDELTQRKAADLKKLVNKDYIYSQLEAKGHKKEKINQFYNMLDLNVNGLSMVYEQLQKEELDLLSGRRKMKESDEKALEEIQIAAPPKTQVKTDEDSLVVAAIQKVIAEQNGNDSKEPESVFIRIRTFTTKNPKFFEYLRLSESDKDAFAQMQQDFRQQIRSLIEKKVDSAEVFKLLRKIQPEMEAEQTDSDGGLTTKEEFIAKIEELDEYAADVRKQKRHQEQYLARLQGQFPDLDVRDIVDRKTMSESSDLSAPENIYSFSGLSDVEGESEEFERFLEEKVVEEEKNTAKRQKKQQQSVVEEVYDIESPEQKAELLAKAYQTCSDSSEAEFFQATDEFLKKTGFMSADGQMDPVIRAMVEQEMIDHDRQRRWKKLMKLDFRHYPPSDGISGFSEEVDDQKLEQKMAEHHEWKDALEEAKGEMRPIFPHPISDLSDIEDKTDARQVMKELWETIDVNMDYYLKKNAQELITPRVNEAFLGRDVRQDLQRYHQYREGSNFENFVAEPRKYEVQMEFEAKMEKYRDNLLYDRLTIPYQGADPHAFKELMHDATVYSMKEQLFMAVNKRKYETLPVVIQLFNSIQSKRIGDSFRLEDFETANVHDYTLLEENEKNERTVNNIKVNDIGTTIQKLDLLLNDSRSPLYSSLRDTQKYKAKQLPENPNDHYIDSEAWLRESVDISSYQKDLDKLNLMQFELDRITKTVEYVDGRIKESVNSVDREIEKLHAAEKLREKEEAKDQNLTRLRLLHHDYIERSAQDAADDEHKVRVMRDVLALELGQSFDVNHESHKTAAQFPVFFALDLINFGIQMNQPAAIRLGEKLLSESVSTKDAKLPQELAMSMKNYMLDYRNNMGYRDAMKITGPLNSSHLYHMSNQQSAAQGITYCLDDPYWQEFTMKNRRREDQWRNPSVFAYRYKQYGMLGEFMDMQGIQKKYDQLFNKPL